MRKFINIVEMYEVITEAKNLGNDVWASVSQRDIIHLADKHGDLRGVATSKEIFVWPAYDDTHYGASLRLGIDPEADDTCTFYVVSKSKEGYEYEGRDDWSGSGYDIGPVILHCNGEGNRQIGKLLKGATHVSRE